MRLFNVVLASLVAIGAMSACSSSGNSAAPIGGGIATSVPTAATTATAMPTASALPSASAAPTATAAPTRTPSPTPTVVPTPTPSPTPISLAPAVYYVADGNSQAVNAYALAANGNVAPTRSIRGGNTGLGFSRRVTLDTTGTLYVANAPPVPANHSITEYAAASNGNVAPLRTISGSNTGLTGADGILVDANGNLYVANCTGCYQSSGTADSIFVFAPGANGNVAPIRTITGPNTMLYGTTNIALDAAGNLIATSSSGSPSIYFFAPGASGNTAPTGIINGPNTGLSQPECVVTDPAGNVYVCNAAANTITEYAPGARGNATPIRILGGAATQLMGPTQLALDAAGTMYVADSGSQSLTVYAPGATGNAAPIMAVRGNATGLQAPIGLTLSP